MLIDVVREAAQVVAYTYMGGEMPDDLSPEVDSLMVPDGGLLKLYGAVIAVLELHQVEAQCPEGVECCAACRECQVPLMDHETGCPTIVALRKALNL